jgi:hypothetical protein
VSSSISTDRPKNNYHVLVLVLWIFDGLTAQFRCLHHKQDSEDPCITGQMHSATRFEELLVVRMAKFSKILSVADFAS